MEILFFDATHPLGAVPIAGQQLTADHLGCLNVHEHNTMNPRKYSTKQRRSGSGRCVNESAKHPSITKHLTKHQWGFPHPPEPARGWYPTQGVGYLYSASSPGSLGRSSSQRGGAPLRTWCAYASASESSEIGSSSSSMAVASAAPMRAAKAASDALP